jgi:hypothetical protein
LIFSLCGWHWSGMSTSLIIFFLPVSPFTSSVFAFYTCVLWFWMDIYIYIYI